MAAILALALALSSGAAGGLGRSEAEARSVEAGPVAAKAGESLVSYVTPRWIPIGRVARTMRLRFRGKCHRGTRVRMRMLLRWPGPDLGPFAQSYSPCGYDVDPSYDVVVFEFYRELSRRQVKYLRAHRTEARLKTRIRGYDPDSGELDFDRRTFRFSR